MFAHHLSPAILLALRGWPVVLLVSDYKCVCPLGSKLLPDGSLCDLHQGWACHRAGCVNFAHWLRSRYALIRSGLGFASRVISCSKWVKQALALDGIASEVLVLPVPPPGASFRRRPAALPTFVFCGRLDLEKGVPLLLRAFARVLGAVRPVRLRIVGRGALRLALERLADELCIASDVTFTGWLDPAEVEEQLADAWALVAPSLWAEPLGLVAVEAIVRGVPVIASASGGLGEVVEHGRSGLLFPNGDEAALVECMLAVAQRRAFPEHILSVEVVQSAARRHAVDDHVKDLQRVFREVQEETHKPEIAGDR